MKRRDFLAGATAATGVIASPAVAQALPEVRWRLASSYPKSLDTLYGAGVQIAKRVAEATDNKFQIQVFAAGEIVGGLQVLDAVQNNTVECAYTLSSYFIGKDPSFMFEASVPFGFNVPPRRLVSGPQTEPPDGIASCLKASSTVLCAC